MSRILLTAAVLCSAALPSRLEAQADSSLLTIDRIYGSPEFRSASFGPASWLGDGSAYTPLEPAAGGGQDLIRYDVERGTREVLVSASQLTPSGATAPLEMDSYSWSPNGRMLLLFTNTQPVWRMNTRGDYWVFDRTAGTLRKL